MRILRAAVAIWTIFEFTRTGDWMIMAIGSLFALQAIFDVGCCGSSGCTTNSKVPKQDFAAQEIEYEEVGVHRH